MKNGRNGSSFFGGRVGWGMPHTPVVFIGHFEIWYLPSWWSASSDPYSFGPFTWRHGIWGQL